MTSKDAKAGAGAVQIVRPRIEMVRLFHGFVPG